MKNRITILHLGIKFWPYNEQVMNNLSLKGIRGGGMNKYCDMLINSFSSNIKTIIICQKLKGQKNKEICGNVDVYRVSTFGNRAIRQIIANIFSFFIAIRILFKEKIDLFHGHMVIGIFFTYLLGKIYIKPVIATPYSFITIEQSFFLNRVSKFLERKIYKKVETLVFESEENKIKAEKIMNVSFINSLVIHTGIKIQRKVNIQNSNEKINILFIGRLVNIKALDNLIFSISYLAPNIKDKIHLNIVGEGELYNKLKELIFLNKLNENITLHGYIDDSSLFFLESDIFILPSHQEGLSISLLEAMSYGLACVINNFGVPFSKDSVFILENNKPDTIAKAISYLVNNKNILYNLKIASKNEIINNFSISSFVEKYEKLYINNYLKK